MSKKDTVKTAVLEPGMVEAFAAPTDPRDAKIAELEATVAKNAQIFTAVDQYILGVERVVTSAQDVRALLNARLQEIQKGK